MFFVDAAHFVLAPFLGYLWGKARQFIKAPPGRQRFNVWGALDSISHEIITITNDTYINAQSVCDMLWKLNRLNSQVPVTLVLDNAKYQRCKMVQNLADTLHIELFFTFIFSKFKPDREALEIRKKKITLFKILS